MSQENVEDVRRSLTLIAATGPGGPGELTVEM